MVPREWLPKPPNGESAKIKTRITMKHLKSNAKQALSRRYVRHFGSLNYCRFAIVGHARTGSNFLLDALSQVPSIKMHDEIFASHNRTTGEDFAKIWQSVFEKQRSRTRAVGFKLFYYHLTPDEWKSFVDDHELVVIHLLRRNRLRTLVSLDIAFSTSRWTESRHGKPTTIRINANTIVERIEELESMEQKARVDLASHPYIELFYEDMIHAPEDEISRVIRLLGIDASIDSQKIGLRKQNHMPLSDTVENYDDLTRALSGTKHEGYLNA